MAAVQQPGQGGRTALPADLWGLIARTTLRAEGDDLRSWERLSLVNRTWRAVLSGAVPLQFKCMPRILVNISEAYGGDGPATASDHQTVKHAAGKSAGDPTC